MDADATGESSHAFRDLEGTFPVVIRALEHGLLEATEYFDSKALAVDGAVFSAIVRLHAREYLKRCRLSAGDLDPVDLRVERVSLCGLWLTIGRYHVKIWKISAQELTRALARQASACQMSLVDVETGIPIIMDLAIYWTSDEVNQLGQLYLVQAHDDPRSLDWVWSREIPQAGRAVEPVAAGDIPVEDIISETTKSAKR